MMTAPIMKFRIVSCILYFATRLVVRTLRLRVVGEERVLELQRAKGMLLVSWHGRSLIPIACFRGRGYWAMISTSRDGEYQHQIFRRFGFRTVRGSTSARGAVQATLTIIKQLKAGDVLSHTPDGPRGPSHYVHPGILLMAQKSGCPIVPVGISASPRRLLSSWDSYLIPLPFARAAMVFGDPIFIPPDLKTEEEHRDWADLIGEAINAMERKADLMVGARVADEGKRRNSKQWRRA